MRQEQKLTAVLDDTLQLLRQAREEGQPALAIEQLGTVLTVSNGVVWVEGLSGVELEELVQFPGNIWGIVLSIEANNTGVVLLNTHTAVEAGAQVRRTGRIIDIPVGEGILGRIVNPLGTPLDNKGPFTIAARQPIEKEAPAIMARDPVRVPLQTGIKVIDALIPVGRGQRQLILGDRQTGKTAIAIDTIINQRDTGVICVYCAIGQRGASLTKIISELTGRDAMKHTVIVIAEGSDAPGMRYIAPYSATSIAEYFMSQGRDVLIVYDDLTNHAQTYREISLLLRRPPGREAFPGDIFYIHSRLLERSTRLRKEYGGGSLTALPIIQTEAQNMSAYIPTNLISITDGQIYLSPELFQKGILPAVDVGRSVSRIGSKAQLGAYRSVAGALKLAYSQFEELEMFSRFGAKLDQQTNKTLRHGERIRACLIQPQFQPLTALQQLTVLIALMAGLFEAVPLDRMPQAERKIFEIAAAIPRSIEAHIMAGAVLDQEDHAAIVRLLQQALVGEASWQ